MASDSTERIYQLLADRYSGGEWAYMQEVPDGTGSKKNRTADAIAIGLWGKNQKQFHAFEVKSSRSDWTRELEDPDKSASWRGVCSSFWLVAGRGVAKIEEVPPDWGFLEVSANGSSLKLRKQPATVVRPSVSLNVVGAIVRRALDTLPDRHKERLTEANDQYQLGYAAGRLREKTQAELAVNHVNNRTQHLEGVVKRLSDLMGQNVEYLQPDAIVARLVKAGTQGRLGAAFNQMRTVSKTIAQLQASLVGIDDRLVSVLSEFEKFDDPVKNTENLLTESEN